MYLKATKWRMKLRGMGLELLLSDWWAYKFEVYDAMSYAGAMMHQRGCIVSFNSDSPDHEKAKSEAAKAVKYGSLTEQEALKFVTLNPAIQLGIDSKVGSLNQEKTQILHLDDPPSRLPGSV